ncbi:PLP-dependent aminotransferase family protein [Streptomyces sp. LP11]|uniref:PLP-dependent aminotransferase family protein n=1 Tax=Streptomyces pyxinicus TaxID=2970331 RepID=A0ABT2AXC4_9ACTN|nr:PLP-dependent aminotransferase family protein [Streptomyces sp. LP11]MCS0600540.1 PLP-dependent aminotransferase family protein [Streptomyces sp. LP11]
MSPLPSGLHLSVVSLGSSRRVCAIWKVGGPVDPGRPCAFPDALLLPRRGAEQDWAAQIAFAALDEQGLGDGPACVDLTTTAKGVRFTALRAGLCHPDLMELAHAALGDGHREWTDLSRSRPVSFHATAAQPYALRQHAAAVTTHTQDGPGRLHVLHRRSEHVLRAYAAARLARSATTPAPSTSQHQETAMPLTTERRKPRPASPGPALEARLSRSARTMVPSEVRALFSAANRPDVVSLAGGMPSPAVLPTEEMATVTAAVLRDSGTTALQYGSAQGDPALRERICGIMHDARITARPDDVLVTGGSQQALDLVARVLLDPGDTVVAEGPTYVTALGTFAAAGARVVQVGMDRDGVIPDELAAAFARLAAQGRPGKIFYTVPTFQNPTGVTLSPRRRLQILDICQAAGVLVIEDDPYGMLHYAGAPPRALAADASEHAVYLGTFSKTLAPGLRVGWVHAPSALTRKLVLAAESATLCHSALAQLTVDRYLRTHPWDEHLAIARAGYRERRDTMLSALAASMPQDVSWTVPDGGFFVWTTFPGGVDARELLPRALAAGVSFVPGTGFYADGRGAHHGRLSFSYPEPEQIELGVRRLASVIAEHR